MNNPLPLVVATLATSLLFAQQPCFDRNYGTSLGAADDAVFNAGPLGFNFPFNGVNYTDVFVSTNGFLYLWNGTTPAPTNARCCAGSETLMVASPDPMICPLWNDHVVVGGVYVNTSAAGCTITWAQTREFGDAANTLYDFQCVLLPTGEIHFSYSTGMTIRTAGNALVGCSEGNNAAVPASSDFSTPGATTANTCFELFDNTALPFDLGGQQLLLLPTSPTWSYVNIPCATVNVRQVGTSCGTGNPLVTFELFSAGTFDLQNNDVLLADGSGAINVLTLPSTPIVPPVSANLGLGDDQNSALLPLGFTASIGGAAFSSISIASNGYIWLGATGAADFSPTAAELSSQGARFAPFWTDLNPTAGGSVHIDVNPGQVLVTWLGVFGYLGTSAEVTCQVEITPSTILTRYDATGGAYARGPLFGFSNGLSTTAPASVDISATAPYVTNVGASPLTLSATGQPTLGGASPMVFTLAGVPTPGIGAVNAALGQAIQPGIALPAPLFGAGCEAYVTNGIVLGNLIIGSTAGSANFGPVPANPAYLGLTFTAQGVAANLGNNTFFTSGAIQSTCGY